MDALQPEPTRAAAWIRWLPGIATLRSYQPRWLLRDLGLGLVLTSALAPVGIAYAVASGLPGACGLYATIVPLLAYTLLGPSRILVLGPDSSLAAIILGIVAPLAAGDATGGRSCRNDGHRFRPFASLRASRGWASSPSFFSPNRSATDAIRILSGLRTTCR